MTLANTDTIPGSGPLQAAWSLARAILRSTKQLLISVPIILLPVFLFILFNEGQKALPDPVRFSELTFDAAFLFSDQFLRHLSTVATRWMLILGLFLSINLIAGWITLLSFSMIIDAISKDSVSFFANARLIGPSQLAKFIVCQFILHVWFVLAAGLLYFVLYQLYARYAWPHTHYLLTPIVLLIPLHFGVTSMCALILMLASNGAHELRLIGIAIRPRNFIKLFSFYAVRVAIEAAVGAVVYLTARTMLSASIAIVVAGIAALLVPLAILRVSSAIYKLTLLTSDPVAQDLALKSLRNRRELDR